MRTKATWKPVGHSAKKFREVGHRKGLMGEVPMFHMARKTAARRKTTGK